MKNNETAGGLPGTEAAHDSGLKYWSIVGGEFVTKADEATPGARKRVNKNDVIVWEIPSNSLTGFITAVKRREGDFGDEFIVTMAPEGAEDLRYNISFMIGETGGYKTGQYFRGVIERLRGVDFSRVVTLRPYNFEDKEAKDRRVIGVSVLQGAKKIDNQFSKKGADGKWQTFHGYPGFPGDWSALSPRDKTNHLFSIREFFTHEIEAISAMLPSKGGEALPKGKESRTSRPEASQGAPIVADKAMDAVIGDTTKAAKVAGYKPSLPAPVSEDVPEDDDLPF